MAHFCAAATRTSGRFAWNTFAPPATDWIGQPTEFDKLLIAADVLLVSLPLTRAVANCRRALLGDEPLHLVGPDDRFVD